ncbi:MAG: cytochrome b [Pseudomonadota bacterium]
MAKVEQLETDAQGRRVEVYSGTARFFHWLTVLLIAVQVPIGLYMVYRGNDMVWTDAQGVEKTGLWDAVTNNLYSSHKLLGTIILVVIVLRLLYRFGAGAPSDEPTLNAGQRIVSALNHWGLYALLIAVPVVGYIGTSAFPALNIFGMFSLPAVVGKDPALSKQMFELHMYGGFALLALIALHIMAALYHYLIRRDYVLARMMPKLLKKRA